MPARGQACVSFSSLTKVKIPIPSLKLSPLSLKENVRPKAGEQL